MAVVQHAGVSVSGRRICGTSGWVMRFSDVRRAGNACCDRHRRFVVKAMIVMEAERNCVIFWRRERREASATDSGIASAVNYLSYKPFVGVIGGYLQSGGHMRISSSMFGMAAGNILEFTVALLTTGQVVAVDACTHPELFWVLHGGGGGTFGVVLWATI